MFLTLLCNFRLTMLKEKGKSSRLRISPRTCPIFPPLPHLPGWVFNPEQVVPHARASPLLQTVGRRAVCFSETDRTYGVQRGAARNPRHAEPAPGRSGRGGRLSFSPFAPPIISRTLRTGSPSPRQASSSGPLSFTPPRESQRHPRCAWPEQREAHRIDSLSV